jgi:hypothetical protein
MATKTSKRALDALQQAGIADTPSALRALVIYAAQNPGLEWGNYVSGWHDKAGRTAFRSDSRRITAAWHLVQTNARICASVGVTDDDIFEACERAFSGRLNVKHHFTAPDALPGRYAVEYCTGQYWPTEYRAAVAAVLDRASTLAFERNCAKQAA